MALYVREKKYITRVCEKNNLTQTNSLIPHPPLSKVKWWAPNLCRPKLS